MKAPSVSIKVFTISRKVDECKPLPGVAALQGLLAVRALLGGITPLLGGVTILLRGVPTLLGGVATLLRGVAILLGGVSTLLGGKTAVTARVARGRPTVTARLAVARTGVRARVVAAALERGGALAGDDGVARGGGGLHAGAHTRPLLSSTQAVSSLNPPPTVLTSGKQVGGCAQLCLVSCRGLHSSISLLDLSHLHH